jgi:hypothetical protein
LPDLSFSSIFFNISTNTENTAASSEAFYEFDDPLECFLAISASL